MAETRPSGTPVVPDETSPVLQEVAEINKRGQLHILSRWAKRIAWLPVSAESALEALMVFADPGLVWIRNWEPDGPRIVARYQELMQPEGNIDVEALRQIQDRYGRLLIPKKERRPYLGDAALQHLGLPTARDAKSNVYVLIFSEGIDILSPTYRNAKNIAWHPALDGLP